MQNNCWIYETLAFRRSAGNSSVYVLCIADGIFHSKLEQTVVMLELFTVKSYNYRSVTMKNGWILVKYTYNN